MTEGEVICKHTLASLVELGEAALDHAPLLILEALSATHGGLKNIVKIEQWCAKKKTKDVKGGPDSAKGGLRRCCATRQNGHCFHAKRSSGRVRYRRRVPTGHRAK